MPSLQASSELLRSAGGKFLIKTRSLFFIALAAFAVTFPGAIFAGTIRPVSGVLHTSDNIPISYDHYKSGFDSVVIICPGFFNSKENKWMRAAVDMLTAEFDVIIFDFRGHGKSGGIYTWSAKEMLDVGAVADYAVSQGYKKIGILAFSLGAAAAVNDVATRNDINSMVLISCPSRFRAIDYHFWEPGMWADLKANIDCGWQGKGARSGNIFLRKEDPIDHIGDIKKTAILFIQGDRDWVINPDHSKKLYDRTSAYKDSETIDGGFHAERLIEFHYARMSALILGWFSKTLR